MDLGSPGEELYAGVQGRPAATRWGPDVTAPAASPALRDEGSLRGDVSRRQPLGHVLCSFCLSPQEVTSMNETLLSSSLPLRPPEPHSQPHHPCVALLCPSLSTSFHSLSISLPLILLLSLSYFQSLSFFTSSLFFLIQFLHVPLLVPSSSFSQQNIKHPIFASKV